MADTPIPQLEWTETDYGWEAPSVLHDEGSPFMWRARPCEWEGGVDTWRIDATDDELDIDGNEDSGPETTFGCLGDAKAWCQAREDELLAAAEPAPADKEQP